MEISFVNKSKLIQPQQLQDPSNDPAYDPGIRDHGIACKTIFDCTVPYNLKDRFERARFMDVDPAHWVKE